ncbi:hypothetical protein ACLOJK_018982 [Asimina triloba]
MWCQAPKNRTWTSGCRLESVVRTLARADGVRTDACHVMVLWSPWMLDLRLIWERGAGWRAHGRGKRTAGSGHGGQGLLSGAAGSDERGRRGLMWADAGSWTPAAVGS